MNDAPYHQKADELLAILAADHVPEEVKLAVPRLSDCHNKLFCMVGEPSVGKGKIPPGIYPSNFLCELVDAMKLSEWPRVLSLVGLCLAADAGAMITSGELNATRGGNGPKGKNNMANIGEPIRRVTVVPISNPIEAPEGPIPARRPEPEKTPVHKPEREPAESI
jgi:hypothetical protein